MTASGRHRLGVFLIRQSYLGILVISFGLMALSTFLFESVSLETILHFEEQLHPGFHAGSERVDAQNLLSEIRARYFWLTSVLLNLGIPLYAIIFGLVIIFRCHSGSRLWFILILAVLFCAFNLSSLLFQIETKSALYRLVFGITYYSLVHAHRFTADFLENVHSIITSVNILASIAPVIVALAFSSVVAPSLSGNALDISSLVIRMRYLKAILNLSAGLLVVGILHMNAWLQWPGELIQKADISAAYSKAALSISIYWGATFTLMLFLTYGPAATYLSVQARKLVEGPRMDTGQIKNAQQWLKEQDLSFTFGDQIPQFMIMLTPLLAGPLQFFLMNPG